MGLTITVSAPSDGSQISLTFTHNACSLGGFAPLSLKLVCCLAGRHSTVITLIGQSVYVLDQSMFFCICW
jgi:hypothetical protein